MTLIGCIAHTFHLICIVRGESRGLGQRPFGGFSCRPARQSSQTGSLPGFPHCLSASALLICFQLFLFEV